MRLSALLALLLAFGPPDIDVGLPPGTPLEWSRDLHQPTPSSGRRDVPSVSKSVPAPDPKAPPKTPGGTVVARPPEPYSYGVTNLYAYFGVTTVDIMSHIKLEFPTGGLGRKGEASGGTSIPWVYPPYMTTETAWIGAAGCLRAILHPEVVSVPEIVAHLCEVGEPSLPGATSLMGPVGVRVKKLVTPVPDDKIPPFKAGATPFETMVNRLMVIELTGGYPASIDPTYARRTLALGDDALKAVTEATRSEHRFLARNAVSVLGQFRQPETLDTLRKLASSPDAVVRYRAISALARRKDRGAVTLLSGKLGDSDEVLRAACAFALGQIGDPKAAAALQGAARGSSDRDFLWSLLPAAARVATPKDAEFFRQMEAKVPGLPPLVRTEEAAKDMMNDRPMAPPKPEPADTKLEILKEMCLLGRAAAGEEEGVKAFTERFASRSLDAFQKPNWYLACDVAAKVGRPAAPGLRAVFSGRYEAAIQQHALLRLYEVVLDSLQLKELATSSANPSFQALALILLADKDERLFREVSASVIQGYSGNSPGRAFVVGICLQQLGRLASGNGNTLEQLSRVAERAIANRDWASRKDDNVEDITKAKIEIRPALLEVAAIELGRLGDPAAVPVLKKILASEADGGRAEALLALGAIGGPEAVDAVVAALDDPRDGWVRYSAYVAAKRLSGQDHFADWIFGTAMDRAKCVAKYRELLGASK